MARKHWHERQLNALLIINIDRGCPRLFMLTHSAWQLFLGHVSGMHGDERCNGRFSGVNWWAAMPQVGGSDDIRHLFNRSSYCLALYSSHVSEALSPSYRVNSMDPSARPAFQNSTVCSLETLNKSLLRNK